ncbi:patatin-like phospholipase family protein [Candidatus Harpocratesius sp.]
MNQSLQKTKISQSSNIKGKTAFVFSGGSSLGAIEVGLLKAIIEFGIKADFVLGTSVGSLNGAIFAYNPTIEGIEYLESVWNKVKFTDVFTPSPITPVKNLTTFGKYLISPKNIRKLIQRSLPFQLLEETTLPFYAVATDLKTGKEIVFNKGIALEALMSSIAIPMVYPPQYMHSMMLVDGGLVNNSAISTAIKLGAENIIVFPIGYPNTPDFYPKNLEQVLARTFLYILARQMISDYYHYRSQVSIHILPSPNDTRLDPFDFSHSKEWIDLAYQRAKAWFEKGGLNSDALPDEYPCDVYSQELHLAEAVIPDKDKPAIARLRENLEEISENMKEKWHEKSTIIKESFDEKKRGFLKRKRK